MPTQLIAALAVVLAAGCTRDRPWAGTGGGGSPLPSPLARDLSRQTPVPTPQPPPPPLAVEPTPPAPPPDALATPVGPPPAQPTQLVGVTPAPEPAADPKPAAGGNVTAIKTIAEAAQKRVAGITDFECRLVKREVVGGKALGPDEVLYRFRAKPLSVYMKVLSDAGQGREVVYVQGENKNKMTVVTGKGDNALVGVGYKMELDPDSRMATAKSRYKASEAGFGRTVNGLVKAVAAAEAGRPGAVKPLGLVTRPEAKYALEGVEVTIPPGAEPLLPKGGVRRIYFDPKPDAPAYMLPVVVETADATGREVEYYFFDQVKLPAGLPAETFDAARLGKK